MPVRQYTKEQLLLLRTSALVKKPDNLPPIEQWIDEAAHPQVQQDRSTAKINTRQPRAAVGGDASPMGNFSTGQRPTLLSTRTTGSRSDDIVLGPPKSTFASSRSITRLASYQESSDSNTFEELENPRIRGYGEHHHQRKTTNEKDIHGERESWTAVRERRVNADAEHTRTDSNTDRDFRARRDHLANNRNVDRQDSRWDRKPNGERQGWRDNTNAKRTWDRSEPVEREPEWFDEAVADKAADDDDLFSTGPAEAQSSDMPARTLEDFQKWKAAMAATHKKEDPPVDEAYSDSAPPRTQEGFQKWRASAMAPETSAALPAAKEVPKPRESLKLDGVMDKSLASFGIRSPDAIEQGLPKPSSAKTKASRFASMFKKDDSPVEMPIVPELPANPVNIAAAQPTAVKNEDKEGFQRILNMLGGTTIGVAEPLQEPRSPVRASANGTRQRSRFFDATPKSPENAHPPMPSLENQQSMAPPPSQPPSNVSPLPPQMTPAHQRSGTVELQGAERLARGGTSTPENTINNIIVERARQATSNSKDAAFLLGLLQGRPARAPAQAAAPVSDFPLWLNSPPETHAPTPRAPPPPPGHIDEALLRNAPHAKQFNEAAQEANRRQTQRPPPGFAEPNQFMQQQYQQGRGFSELNMNPAQLDQARHAMMQQGLPPDMQQMQGPPGFPSGAHMPFPPYMANGQRGMPVFPPGIMPGQPGPPPGFGRGMMPHAGPPGLMPQIPGPGNPGRGGFDNVYDRR